MHAQTTRVSPQSSSQPFSSQDLISNSLYYLQYSSLVVCVENLVFDIFLYIHHFSADISLMLQGEILFWLFVEVRFTLLNSSLAEPHHK